MVGLSFANDTIKVLLSLVKPQSQQDEMINLEGHNSHIK